MKKIAIIGATSAIAHEAAKIWAKDKAEFFLVARNREKLEKVAADLDVRGASKTHCYCLDANDFSAHGTMVDTCFTTLRQVEIVLIAYGSLPRQEECEKDLDLAVREFSTNATSTIALLGYFANGFAGQKFGTLAVISSVAGDRGRPSIYLYGSAKAAVSQYCQGLRARLFSRGVSLCLIKPGMVETPMTAGLSLPKALTAEASRVGEDIVLAIARKKDVIYTPGYWFFIMLVIRCIPNFIFKRLNL